MKFVEALKIVLCDSEKGIDYDKTIVGKDFELTFGLHTCADCFPSMCDILFIT